MPPFETDTTPSYSLVDFDYPLPTELIAKYPLPNRQDSRMMCLNRATQNLAHNQFTQLQELLQPGDLLVLNNAKVIPARLIGHKAGMTGEVELFLLRPATQDNGSLRHWEVLMRPARRLKPGATVVFEGSELEAVIEDNQGEGHGIVSFTWPDTCPNFWDVLETVGQLPIPPYLDRLAEASDKERYQTVFASKEGAQAAPTAGLHFTPEVLDTLRQQGVGVAEVTLMVSAGTFRPVLSDTIAEHKMDPEAYTIDQNVADAIVQTKASGGRVIAVGTTVLKTLESSATYNQGQPVAESRWSDLFITPGFGFQVVDGLLTNFHLPKSTLMMLVSAFAGHELIKTAYEAAIQERYRFYSYGDCMLIL